MPFPAAYRRNANLAEVSFEQNASSALVSALNSKEIIDGVLIEGIVLDTTGVNVAHGLGREWNGWCVVDITAAGDVYRTASDDESVFLKLRASSGTPTVSVWVF